MNPALAFHSLLSSVTLCLSFDNSVGITDIHFLASQPWQSLLLIDPI